MGVYIKGMDMPDSCEECNFDNGMFCNAYPNSANLIYDIADGIPEWCPLVEVPQYEELLKSAKAMHTWIFLHSGDEQKAYDECNLSDEMNALLGYGGQFVAMDGES